MAAYMVFGFIPYVSAAPNMYITNKGYKLTYAQFQNLKDLGFSDEEINLMEEEELNYNKDIKATLVGTDIKYSKIVYRYRLKNDYSTMSSNNNSLLNNNYPSLSLNYNSLLKIINDNNIDSNEENILELVSSESSEITEEEYNRIGEESEYSINGEDIVETTGKKLVTTISYLSSSNRYRLKNSLTWKNMPKNREEDLFGIIYEEPNANTVVGSQKAYYNYTVYNGCTGKTNSYQVDYSNAKYWYTKTKSYYLSMKLKENESIRYDWPFPTVGQSEVPCPCINPPALHTIDIVRENTVQSMSATMYYDIAKSTSTKVKMLTIAGEYQHA